MGPSRPRWMSRELCIAKRCAPLKLDVLGSAQQAAAADRASRGGRPADRCAGRPCAETGHAGAGGSPWTGEAREACPSARVQRLNFCGMAASQQTRTAA
jgi:hypothetical protein